MNPFSIAYLAEAGVAPDELLARYSFYPFRHIQGQISRNTNVFLVGRRGVGKTMILRLFAPDLFKRLSVSDIPEHQSVFRMLPEAAVGVYFNMASPAPKITLFNGTRHELLWWQIAFGDYLNCVLFELSIHAIEAMAMLSSWRERVNLEGERLETHPEIFDHTITMLRDESSEFDDILSFDQLRKHFQARAQRWSRYLNSDPAVQAPPSTLLPLGIPLFALVSAFRRLCPTFRLFLLIDQYEALYQRHKIIDFRPVFNQAMYLAARGGTGVEFKIGARPYSHRNLSLLESDGQIEADREMIEVDLDRFAQKYYRKFVMDLFEKRLGTFLGSGKSNSRRMSLMQRVPAFLPREEAERYQRADAENLPKLVTPFLNRWEVYGITRHQSERALEEAGIVGRNPLVVALACIAITRWLRDGTKSPPVGCELAKGTKSELLRIYIGQLIRAIDNRYDGAENDSKVHSKRIDNFIHDVEQAALFQIASAYKNQRKYFAGLDTVILVSSNIAVVFIEIMRAAYERLLLDGGDPGQDSIAPEIQSEAIYRVSETYFRNISTECDFGQSLQEMLRAFGGQCRRLQLELTVPIPCPNGFSCEASKLKIADHETDDIRSDANSLINLAIIWGLLEEYEHQDKKRGNPKRRKLLLNRVYCPYFGITAIRRKDPLYVKDLQSFIMDLIKQKTPHEIEELLRRSAGREIPPLTLFPDSNK